VYCRRTKRLICWHIGGRHAAELSKLKHKLSDVGVRIIHVYSDDYQAYKCADFERHTTGKAHTHGVERDNSRTRHWFARFRRRGLTVSKSIHMIELTIRLYAHFHFNNNLKNISSILK
jgi:insertion element IS1 protein InsB